MAPLIVVAVATTQALASTPAASPQDLAFKDARIGMTLPQWQALAFPGAANDHAVTACAPSAATAAQVVCTYAVRDGAVTFPQAVPLTKTYLARRPTYTFIDGRLSRIEFHASVDAFNDVMAGLEATYGPASQTLRDQTLASPGITLPRVQKVWRRADGAIRLIDPSARADELSVIIASQNDTSQPLTQGARGSTHKN